jgi:hypothetical protein
MAINDRGHTSDGKLDARIYENAKRMPAAYMSRDSRESFEVPTAGPTVLETNFFHEIIPPGNQWQSRLQTLSPKSTYADDVRNYRSYTTQNSPTTAPTTSMSAGAQFKVEMSYKQQFNASAEDLKEDRWWVGEDEQKADENDENKQQQRNEGWSEAKQDSSTSTEKGLIRDDVKVNVGRVGHNLSLQSDVTCEYPQRNMTFLARPQTPNIQITNVYSHRNEFLSPVTPISPPSPRSHMTEILEQRSSQSPVLDQPTLAARKTDAIDVFLNSDDFTDLVGNPELQEKERKNLRALRIESFKRRGELRTRRQQLRRLEYNKIEADAAFMKFVTKRMAQTPLPSQGSLKQSGDLVSDLDTYYAAMQAARDEYSDLEGEYNQLSESLDDLEFKLAQAESRVYKTPQGTNDLPIDSTGTKDLLWDEKSDTSWAEEQEYHPLHAKLLDKLGDLDLVTEKFDYLKQKLDHDQRMLREHGADLEYESKESFEQLNASVKELTHRLGVTENERSRIVSEFEVLKANCEYEGIYLQTYSTQAEDFSEDISALEFEKDNQIDLQAGGVAKDSAKRTFTSLFPSLVDKKKDLDAMISEFDETDLSKPNKVTTFRDKQTELDIFITHFDEGNKSDRINRWLFHALRVSPLGIDLLAQIILKVSTDISKINTENVKHFVASTWFTDEANYSSDHFTQPISHTCATQWHHAYTAPT